jgi:hypothetical protein
MPKKPQIYCDKWIIYVDRKVDLVWATSYEILHLHSYYQKNRPDSKLITITREEYANPDLVFADYLKKQGLIFRAGELHDNMV